MTGVSQGSVMKLVLFNDSINENDREIECPLSKFVDAWCSLLARKVVWHPERPRQAEQWAQVDFMRFSESKHKVMDMGCGNIHLVQGGG